MRPDTDEAQQKKYCERSERHRLQKAPENSSQFHETDYGRKATEKRGYRQATPYGEGNPGVVTGRASFKVESRGWSGTHAGGNRLTAFWG